MVGRVQAATLRKRKLTPADVLKIRKVIETYPRQRRWFARADPETARRARSTISRRIRALHDAFQRRR